MRRHRLLARLFLAATFVALSGMRLAAEEQSLMTTDGTLHVVSTGRAIDLGIQDANIPPERYLIEWTAKAQDGTISMAILPHTISSNGKRDLQLAFDEQTGTLVLLWTEDVAYSDVHVGVLRNGVWTNSGLLPTQGIALASNPKMVITHRGVTYLDEKDNPVSKTSSILSIVWWEDALIGQARLANVFLDEQSFDTANLTVYDLPTLSGGGGDVSYDGIPSGAYAFPNLQPDGLTGSVLVSYADLHDQTQRVARIDFPTDIGKPSDAASLNWKRRHIPIYGVAAAGPIARMTPNVADVPDGGIGTSIGSGYWPTFYWRDQDGLKFTRLGPGDWSPLRSIAIDDQMTYEKALDLVKKMGERN